MKSSEMPNSLSSPSENLSVGCPRSVGVGVLIHSVDYGGIDTIVLNWLKAMDQERFRIYLFTTGSIPRCLLRFLFSGRSGVVILRSLLRSSSFALITPGSYSQRLLDKAAELGFTVHQIPWSRRKPFLHAARNLADYIRLFQLDILHCHDPYGNSVGAFVKRYVDVKTVTTFHAWGESGWRLRILEWTDVRLSRFFDQLTAVSEAA